LLRKSHINPLRQSFGKEFTRQIQARGGNFGRYRTNMGEISVKLIFLMN